MAAAPKSLGEIALGTVGEAIAFAAGFAAARALEPIGVGLAQEAWKLDPNRAPDAGTMAAGVAQGQVPLDKAREYAAKHGYGEAAFAAMVDVANTGPALGYAFTAWRRGFLSDDEFTAALRRSGLETQWYDAMRRLKDEPLEPGEIAKAVHRGIMEGEGLLVATPSTAAGKVPRVPPSTLNPVREGAASGLTSERLRVLVGNAGLPPSPGELLQLLNRGHITEADYSRGVGESNLRNEWADALIHLRRRLLTPHEYADARLRGWVDDGAMYAGAALSGLNHDDTDLLHKLMGRPLSFHQVWVGTRRGGRYDGPHGDIDHAFLRSLEQSNIRPEWYDIAWKQRYNYPSPFVLRAMARDGAISRDEYEQVLVYQGMEPGFSKRIADHYTKPAQASSDSHVGKAGTQLWSALHRSYVNGETETAQAHDDLAALGVPAEAQTQVLALWDKERQIVRRELTPTQIKKAVKSGKWQREEALARLLELGYTDHDAATLLDE